MDSVAVARDGLLLQNELDTLTSMVRQGRSPDEIDDQARVYLATRGAMTDWERKSREAGARNFLLGHHRLFDGIANGETYEVYIGQNLFTGRIDVIKVLQRSKNRQHLAKRHVKKLRVHALINRSNFVILYDAGFALGVEFAIFEYGAQDLRTFALQNGALPMHVASAIVANLASALSRVHNHGTVFGNLQPNKVLLCSEGDIKLCDAGLGEPAGRIPLLAEAPGTALDYLAPEAIAGDDVTPASDIYSLGCLLYYAVTGKVPFPGGTEVTKRQGHVSHFPLDPRRLTEGLDDEFVDVISAMMAKDRQKRIQSADEVVARLQPWGPCKGGRGTL